MSSDSFRFRQFTVRQELCAMKVGTDGVLLGAWAHGGKKILDVGTGTGLIALMMAQRYTNAQVTGIDIDAAAVRQARDNAAASPFSERIEIRLKDLKDMTAEQQWDAIVSNPPYFTDSLRSPDRQRTLARHTDTLPFRLLIGQASQLLSDDGELSVIIAAESRSSIESEAALAGLFKSRECAFRTSFHKPARRYLLAFRKHPATLEREELLLNSEAYNELTKDYYL